MIPFLTASTHHELLPQHVLASAVGPHQYLTLGQLIRLFQEAAMRNTERLGISSQQLMQQYGLTWVLHRQVISADHWPSMGERVTVVTIPTHIERSLITYRDFYLLDRADRVIVRSTSAWSVMNYRTRRLKPVPQAIIDLLDDLPPAATHLPWPGHKPAAPPTVERQRERRVDFAHLDFNNHLTNSAFAELMLEPLGADFLSTYLPLTADITYRHEARYDDLLTAELAAGPAAPLCFAHGLRRSSELLATMRTTWQPLA